MKTQAWYAIWYVLQNTLWSPKPSTQSILSLYINGCFRDNSSTTITQHFSWSFIKLIFSTAFFLVIHRAHFQHSIFLGHSLSLFSHFIVGYCGPPPQHRKIMIADWVVTIWFDYHILHNPIPVTPRSTIPGQGNHSHCLICCVPGWFSHARVKSTLTCSAASCIKNSKDTIDSTASTTQRKGVEYLETQGLFHQVQHLEV